MKRFKYFVILIILISLICCNNSQIINDDSAIDVELKDATVDFQDTSLIKDIFYVFLETKKECLIGSCDKILTKNNNVYILDRTSTNTVYTYDKNGNFIFKIDKQGKGPGEYIQMMDFYVDDQENIYIWDIMNKNIIKYSMQGEKYEKFNMKYYFQEFSLIGNNKIIARNVYDKGQIKASLAKIDLLSQESEINIKARPIYDDMQIVQNSSHYLFKSENSVLFNPMFSNEIFEINDGNIIKKIIFNSDYFPNEDFVRRLKADPMLKYTEDKYITGIVNIYQNSEVYAMTLIKGMIQLLVIDKKNNKSKVIVDFSNRDYFGNSGIFGVFGDYFISRLNTRLIQDENWPKKIRESNLPEKTKEKLLRLDINANPVLIFFKIK